MPYDEGNSWKSAPLTDESRADFFAASLDSRASAERDADAVRRLGLMFGAGGMLCGILGIAAGLVVYIKTPVPTPPDYVRVNTTTGVIEPPTPAKDAPKIFTELVHRRAIWDFIVACEGYVPETWVRSDYHLCMIHASPAEQKRRDADIGKNGTRYPVVVFGDGGWAKPTAALAYVPLGSTGSDPNKTYHCTYRYERTEVIGGREARARYTADVYYQFHPEMNMNPADRLANPAGFQAVSFSTVRDP